MGECRWVGAAGAGGCRSVPGAACTPPGSSPPLEAARTLPGALGMQLALAPWCGRGLLAGELLSGVEGVQHHPSPPSPSQLGETSLRGGARPAGLYSSA